MRYLLISLFFYIFSFSRLPAFEGSSYLFCSKKDSLPYLIPKSITLNPKGNVFIWMNAECSICNKYPNIWKKLALEFPEFTFIGVFTSYEESKMAKGFMKKYKIPYQWFIDKENRLAAFLKVTTTPEVLFIDAKANIIYRGATDDWFYALGKNKPVPQKFYLKNALKAYGNNQPVLIFKTDPIGCIFK
jgi:thioredoxin-related protein